MWIVWYKLNGELHRISCGCGPESPGYAWRCYMEYFSYGAWIEYEASRKA